MLLILRRRLFNLWLFRFLLLLLFFFFFFLGGFYLGLLFGLGGGFAHLVHAYDEIRILDADFFDGIVVVESFALEDHFEGIGWHALDLLDFGFKDSDLNSWRFTVSAGSTSTWKTSPFRFLILSFITT